MVQGIYENGGRRGRNVFLLRVRLIYIDKSPKPRAAAAAEARDTPLMVNAVRKPKLDKWRIE